MIAMSERNLLIAQRQDLRRNLCKEHEDPPAGRASTTAMVRK